MPDHSSEALIDVRLLDIPGYLEWSTAKLNAGESPAIIAHLDATSMLISPSELATVTHDEFQEMLDEVESSLDRAD